MQEAKTCANLKFLKKDDKDVYLSKVSVSLLPHLSRRSLGKNRTCPIITVAMNNLQGKNGKLNSM